MTPLVLLTGGTGFVGRQVLRALTESGARVRVILREGSAESRLGDLSAVESIVRTPDLFREPVDWWAKTLEGVDTVAHVAWYAEPGKYLQSPESIVCLEGTLRMAQGAALAGVKRFVGVGTCFEYDLSAGMLATDTPLRPISPYAGAKAAVFMALSQWLPLHRISFAWCRLFYLFGEGEDERRLFPYLRAQLAAGKPVDLTSGNQIRDFLDVREAGRQIADIGLGDKTGAANICSGIPVTVRQIAERLADEYGRRDLLRFGVRPDNLVDPPCVVGLTR
ncbi:Polysaccharide capsule synthesis protein CpsJ [Neorhizobium galegae bv. officinalis]|uniref:Polysaccharide capsule synthesis protein CpsJ n=1 Tax=Neorhizobium galegae bv. officinalis TaxID=323656 RepID=A0A0T7F9S9_NEOGA|nr:NAD(P)-dependent oxidoreductase [Neorhizobium galegae]CDZ31711.1 Polysaccharide capsule synthesis protein CpsJ [Neorhizobium galegae bv. officinalis]